MKTYFVQHNRPLETKDLWRKNFTTLFDELNTRDLRPVFSPMQVSTILARGNVVIVNLGFIKAVLTTDTAYFLVHSGEQEIENIAQKISVAKGEGTEHVFLLFALEKILEAQLLRLRSSSLEIETDTEKALSRIRNNFSEAYLENLLSNKKRISKISSQVSEVRAAVEEIIEDSEDLNQIASLVRENDQALDELTSIFENFIEQVEDIEGHMLRLRESVDDTEEFLTLKLNARRTAIIRADLLATITTLILSFLAVVVGLYGTNISNGLEQNPEAFMILRMSLIIFFVLGFIGAFLFLKKKRLF